MMRFSRSGGRSRWAAGLLAWSAAFAGALSLQAAGPVVPATDPEAVVAPAEPAWLKDLSARLAAFSREQHLPIVFRFHAKSPSEEEDKVPGAYMKRRADELGTRSHGVLAVYFADENDWRVWFSDDLTGRIVGRAGTAEEFTRSGAMHDAKEALLERVQKDADARAKAAAGAATPGPAERLKAHTEALADALMAALRA